MAKSRKCPNCFGEMNLSSIAKYVKEEETHRRTNVAYFCTHCKTIFLNPAFADYKIVYTKMLFNIKSLLFNGMRKIIAK